MATALAAHREVEAAIAMFEAWVETQRAYREQPGLSVGVLYDQELIWARGFGYQNLERREPATPGTIYRIASITKLFTATSIMQLRDRGLLQLDDAVAKVLPWFRVSSRFGDAPTITIRHLLTHTSGLPRESSFPYWTDGAFPSREQMIGALPDQEAVYAPETRWKYSNLALSVAGEIVAAVSGQPYDQYVQEHILGPLGMTRTSVVLPEAHMPHLAIGYTRRLPGAERAASPLTDCAGITPAANMSSTVEDLARFAALQLRDGAAGGSQILKGSTLREMQRIHWLSPDWKSGWGLGFMVARLGERTLVGHSGAVPGHRTRLSICPAERLAFVVLANADDGDPDHYVNQAWSLLAPAVGRATAPPPAAPAEADLARYTGLYRSLWGDTQVILQHGQLVLFSPLDPDPALAAVRLTPEGEHRFRAESDNGFFSVGEPVVFELDEQGRAARVKTGANYSERV